MLKLGYWRYINILLLFIIIIMPKAENKTLRATFFWHECYLANQPLSAVGVIMPIRG